MNRTVQLESHNFPIDMSGYLISLKVYKFLADSSSWDNIGIISVAADGIVLPSSWVTEIGLWLMLVESFGDCGPKNFPDDLLSRIIFL